jgi:NADH-ubiquinone oxidoreductase chain 2
MVILTSCYILLINAVTFRRDKYLSHNRVISLILLYSIFIALTSLHETCIETGIGIYGGLYQVTPTSQNFFLFIILLTYIILQIISFYPTYFKGLKSKDIWEIFRIRQVIPKLDDNTTIDEQDSLIDYSLVILFILTGAVILMSSCDLISMFLSIELQSYGLYILSTIYRNSELATFAGLTYFLLGGLSSCFILLGLSLIYVNTAQTCFDYIYLLYNSTNQMTGQVQDLSTTLPQDLINEILIKSNEINPIQSFDMALILLAVGYLFKVSAAPFHFWSPDRK